jgi:hypothetical protein
MRSSCIKVKTLLLSMYRYMINEKNNVIDLPKENQNHLKAKVKIN